MAQSDFSRQIILDGFGEEGQAKLISTDVIVFGAGGLASTSIPYLAAAGVGNITIVDPDRVELSNLHRQIPYDFNTLGRYKAEACADFISSRSSIANIRTINRKLSEIELLEESKKHDIILDCSDDDLLSYILSDCSLVTKKPVIFGNASGFDGQLFSMAPNIDGPSTACWRCLWPFELRNNITCDVLGVLGPVPGTIGCLQALEAIKYIVGYGLSTRMLLRYSFKNLKQTQFRVNKAPECNHDICEQDYRKRYIGNYIYSSSLTTAAAEGYIFIDIRGPSDTSEVPPSSSVLNIDMYDLLEAPNQHLHPESNYLILCNSGPRAQYAATRLRETGYKNVFAYIKTS